MRNSLRDRITTYLDETINNILELEADRRMITDELRAFAAQKGASVKESREVNLRLECKDQLIDLLCKLTEIIKPDIIEPFLGIQNIVMKAMYFIELDYDSPTLRKQELVSWEKMKNESRKSINDGKRYTPLRSRIKQRKQWMKMRRGSGTAPDPGYKEDRRDLHGILLLNQTLNYVLTTDHRLRIIPFVEEGLLLEQNRGGREVKINFTSIICHLMYFLGFSSPKSEESIRKIIKEYYQPIFGPFHDDKSAFNSKRLIYIPQDTPWLMTERILWEEIHFREIGRYTSIISSELPPVEWLIASYWRSSLIKKIDYLDRILLASYICRILKQDFKPNDVNLIISQFENSFELRNC